MYFPLNNEWITEGRIRYAIDINDENATVIANTNVLLNKLTDGEDRHKHLSLKWNQKFFDTKIPLNAIRDYYGEKIAM